MIEDLDHAYEILKEHRLSLNLLRKGTTVEALVNLGLKFGPALLLTQDVRTFSNWLNAEEAAQQEEG